MMKKTSRALAACLMLSSLAILPACGRKDEPVATTSVSPPGAAMVERKGASVALPPSEVPKSDAAMTPQSPAPAATIPDSASPSQANPTTLSKHQESTAMPINGQTNNYSPPEPIKKSEDQQK